MQISKNRKVLKYLTLYLVSISQISSGLFNLKMLAFINCANFISTLIFLLKYLHYIFKYFAGNLTLKDKTNEKSECPFIIKTRVNFSFLQFRIGILLLKNILDFSPNGRIIEILHKSSFYR